MIYTYVRYVPDTYTYIISTYGSWLICLSSYPEQELQMLGDFLTFWDPFWLVFGLGSNLDTLVYISTWTKLSIMSLNDNRKCHERQNTDWCDIKTKFFGFAGFFDIFGAFFGSLKRHVWHARGGVRRCQCRPELKISWLGSNKVFKTLKQLSNDSCAEEHSKPVPNSGLF